MGFAIMNATKETCSWPAARSYAELLTRHGRAEEMYELLEARIAAPARRWPAVELGTPEPGNAVELPAAVRERQGRVEEATTLLQTRPITSPPSTDATNRPNSGPNTPASRNYGPTRRSTLTTAWRPRTRRAMQCGVGSTKRSPCFRPL